jgi:hypothetical protein
LWNSLPATILVEGALFVAGVVLYARHTRAKNKRGEYGFWSLVAFLVVTHGANLFGPIPTNSTDIAWAGQLQWLLVLWGWWVDRNRQPFIRHQAAAKAVG